MKEIRIEGVISGLDATEHDVLEAIIKMVESKTWSFGGSVQEIKEESVNSHLKKALKGMETYVDEKVIKPIKEAVHEILKDKKDADRG